MTQTPAGWHPDPEHPGQQRYWDGQRWTEHRAPLNPPPPVAVMPSKKKRGMGFWLLAVILVVVLIGGISALSGGSSSNPSDTSAASTDDAKAQNADATVTPSSKPQPKKPSYTVAQQNAIRSAEQYLSLGSGFSRAGLIDQLSSSAGNGYSRPDAVFAANHSGANWRQQAVLAAKNYMSLTGFSRASLIEQLTSKAGSKFTSTQAAYAADQVGLK